MIKIEGLFYLMENNKQQISINFKKALLLLAAGVFLLYTLYFILYTPTANAAGVSISPLTFDINANPGDIINNSIRITNTEDLPLQVNIEVENFAPRGEEGRVVVSDDFGETYSLKTWLLINTPNLTLQGGESRVIDFTLSVPQNAEPGGHYGSILASVGGGAGAGQVGIAQKIGSLLLVNVAGPVEESMWVKSMSPIIEVGKDNFEETDFLEYGPVTLRTRFENTGTIHLKPRGFILLRDMFGREVARKTLEEVNVLPNSIRRVDMELGQRWMLGKYTADMTAIYGSRNEPLTFSTSFWVVPWKVVSAVAVGALILLWLLVKARKRIRLAFKILFRGG